MNRGCRACNPNHLHFSTHSNLPVQNPIRHENPKLELLNHIWHPFCFHLPAKKRNTKKQGTKKKKENRPHFQLPINSGCSHALFHLFRPRVCLFVFPSFGQKESMMKEQERKKKTMGKTMNSKKH